MTEITFESASVEALSVPITSRVDPTGDAVEFAVSTTADDDPTGSWVAGAWDGSYNATTGKVMALTPTLGASGAQLTVTQATPAKLWVRWTIGSETIVRHAATLTVI